ncbi:MAG: mannose-6-phosphate isomerase [Candidatus Margulisiibacteriota bacterium]|nr:MAG: mannose-6-phosphate isomerase [Candidatus Margulisbacteria bacterium GWD2_39_127]OGI04766.1 MAG: mannose-6-phosphate isomerase [Candidatus Margulisbacteria bacterium GWF2_38_17]OGI05711.1 MAG: mannose-6-phosphate isomerase [Candidatus Margulisbacteria bacterium GWE2_39_32]PZM83646.1 MAG: mannose-6-phosphate isomerase [Candidatus Margulisiibacteriota bacterium]HAR62064.1 mannose-6-phosphate isomerase [Candidatus Margulisiibacteriota bacterium]
MRIAMLSPVAWRTPPHHYGPWESFVSLLTEGLVARGIDVTLFATADSITKANLRAACPIGYEEDKGLIPKVWECLHISELIEHAEEFDLIHNNFDFLPLTYSSLISTPMVTTIHGFSSQGIIPVYEKYDGKSNYISISHADRSPRLHYLANIYHGIDIKQFTFNEIPQDYLLFFGRMHRDKGAREAIEIAKKSGRKLIMAGIIQDAEYYEQEIKPLIDGENVIFIGSADPQKRDELLGGALALLHPINFNEPFGLSVIESMACGTPVIAFNRGSMPELITHGKNGFLVSSIEEAVIAVQESPTISRIYCRDFAKKYFNADRMVDDYIKAYEQILVTSKREDHRPWGFYKVLHDAVDAKIKQITVYPKMRLSLQSHQKRSEHWFVVSGEGTVTINDRKIKLKAGDNVDIRRGDVHRIENSGPANLVFTEVQVGEYFGEDDIRRFEDDYGRAA